MRESVSAFLGDVKELILRSITKAVDDDIITHGAAIAFYTLFSIAPLFILIISIGSIFLSEEVLAVQFQEFLSGLFDEEMATTLTGFFQQRSLYAAGLLTSVIAIITIVFGATTVISQLKSTLNKIWNITDVSIHSVWIFLLNRLLSFGMILLFSLMLLLSLLAEATLGVLSVFFTQLMPELELNFYRIVSKTGTFGFSVLFFFLIFKILPDVHTKWTDIIVGALVTALLFLVGKYLIGLYLSATGIEATFKAAGVLVVFVIWVYYNIQIILFGAVFTQVYTDMYGHNITPYRFVKIKRRPE